MQAFYVRWRSAKQHREYEIFADKAVGIALYRALMDSGGWEVWEAGMLWRCPGCYDCTLRTEEFLEGLRRAENALYALQNDQQPELATALHWIHQVTLKMLSCERDRVYLKDAGHPCRYSGETYTSRI